MGVIRRIYQIALRECGIMSHNPIYLFCMVVFPLFVTFFFTSLLNEGVPSKLPCGVVDLDNTPTTRSLIRHLDGFQTTQVTHYYNNINDARRAIQRGEIYGVLYFPRGTTADLLGSRQPTVSFYYNGVVMMAGNMAYKDMKTVTTLAQVAVASTKLSALGKTKEEIKAFLQPIALDIHMIGNPWMNYNIYLSSVMVPGIMILFMLLITAYSIGTEMKFSRAREWMQMAGGSSTIAVAGKLLPQFLVFVSILGSYAWYIFGYLNFPHPGGNGLILLLVVLTVMAAQSFGVFVFALMPSLRMSMSICSLWGVLSFSTCGATYPVDAMNPMIEALSWLFPLRHYYMIYQINIFNGYPMADAWPYYVCLLAFIMLPMLNIHRIKKAMLEYVYIP